MGKQKVIGTIDLNGTKPLVHEYAAYLVLAQAGKNIRVLPVQSRYKVSSPDFIMDGLVWELKCPQGKGKYLIRDTLRQALRQSENVVVDLRRAKLSQEKCLNQLRKYFQLEKRLKRLLVITKEKEVIDISK